MKETLLLTKTFLKNGFRSSDKGKFKVGAYIVIISNVLEIISAIIGYKRHK